MKKAGKFIALILLLVCVPCWTGALNFYSTCGGLDIDDLEGVYEGDGMRIVTYTFDRSPTVTVTTEEERMDFETAWVVGSGTLFLLDPFSLEMPDYPESSLKTVWTMSFTSYNGNDVKMKVCKDLLYDGKYEGKVFRLTKVSGPSDEPPYWDFPGWTENNSSAD